MFRPTSQMMATAKKHVGRFAALGTQDAESKDGFQTSLLTIAYEYGLTLWFDHDAVFMDIMKAGGAVSKDIKRQNKTEVVCRWER